MLQASLPVKSCRLGFHCVASLASLAFISSAVGAHDLKIRACYVLLKCLIKWLNLVSRCGVTLTPYIYQTDHQQPYNNIGTIQQCTEFSIFLQHQAKVYRKARILAAALKHSADWLHDIRITSCLLGLDNDAIRIAIGLRLSAGIYQPHACCCSAQVDVRCRSSGRLIRHNHVNDAMHATLVESSWQICHKRTTRTFASLDGPHTNTKALRSLPGVGCYRGRHHSGFLFGSNRMQK